MLHCQSTTAVTVKARYGHGQLHLKARKLDRNPPSTRGLGATFYLILIPQMYYHFNTILIILYIHGMTLRSINVKVQSYPC
jgi:hypothetical protein